MAVDISAEITRNWPQTEAKLATEEDADYATQKAAAIGRAKTEAYGDLTVPAEASIPDRVAYWIADRATIYLISVGKEYYAIQERKSTTKEGATVTHYDKVAMLEGLRRELEEACNEGWATVQELVGASGEEDAIPAISTDGMYVDPVTRAMNRGPW